MNITTGVALRPPPPCASAIDCNLNGVCVAGLCECDAGWRADDCGELALLPKQSLDGAYQHAVDLADCAVSCGPSSWGGLPLKGPDGKYHLFASQFVHNCTLAGWNPGSTVVRAVAESPEGPYTYAETVFETFHHNPTVRKLTKSQSGVGKPLFVMLMIGDDTAPPVGFGAKCAYDESRDPHHLEGYIALAYSETLVNGTWTKLPHEMVTPGDINAWDAMVTNPSPFFYDNGTALIFYRGTRWPSDGLERIGVARAASWRGPYVGRGGGSALRTPSDV
jgi:hypothetical protein